MSTGFAEPTTTTSPPASPEEPLYEVVNGVKVELPPMSIQSNLIAGDVYFALRSFLVDHPIGTPVMEALLIIDPEANLRRRPDVAFVSANRWPLDREVPETGDWEVVPTIAIEVTSTHDLARDVEEKTIEYFAHGVEAVWVVHPEHRRIYCYSSPTETMILDEKATLDGGDILPGFKLPLNELFRRSTATA
ncbi:MAG: Uma2 family endonuclease [Planctomycetaceae bacterium]|nr:Uma2 family endonuclease [Planctomycetaceae bacterium]